MLIVFPLIDIEDNAGAEDVFHGERFDGVGQIDAFAASRCADLQRAIVRTAHLCRQPDAGNAIIHLAALQAVGALAVEDVANARDVLEIPVNALEGDDERMAPEEEEGIVFQAFGCKLHLGVALHLPDDGIVGLERLALHRRHLQFRVEVAVERGDEVVKTIEDGEDADHGRRGDGNARRSDAADDIDGIMAFLGEKVAPCDEKRKVHGRRSQGTALLFQEFVDVLQIVHRIVDEEFEFGDDAQLMPHARAELIANARVLRIDALQDVFRLLRGEDADVCAAYAHVGADVSLRDAHDDARHGFGIFLEDVAQFLL